MGAIDGGLEEEGQVKEKLPITNQRWALERGTGKKQNKTQNNKNISFSGLGNLMDNKKYIKKAYVLSFEYVCY